MRNNVVKLAFLVLPPAVVPATVTAASTPAPAKNQDKP